MKRSNHSYHLMRVFCEVVHQGSFTRAAKVLETKTSSISKAVTQLEHNLGVQLLFRTTRSLSLTDNGRLYFEEAKVILERVSALEEAVAGSLEHPAGTLRITSPVALGQFLIGPALPAFIKSYPAISVDLILEDKVLDMTREGFDIAIRSSRQLEDSSLYTQPLVSLKRCIVATPEYLNQRDPIQHPEDLSAHQAVGFSSRPLDHHWSLSLGNDTMHLEMRTKFRSNNYMVLLEAVLQGVGIGNFNSYMVSQHIEAGRLEPVLPQWQQEPRLCHAYYHQRRDRSPKLNAFLSFLEERNHEA